MAFQLHAGMFRLLSRHTRNNTQSPIVSSLLNQHSIRSEHVNHAQEKVTPISKVLIANRGEIACRVMQSTARMGIQSVACYSDADEHSMHVSMADEAFHIGASPATESYLVMEKIINVAKKSGAQAIHPGYGFLSEKPEFANLCEQEGILFIGPPSTAIRDMGIKSTSKYIMSAAGVPIIEGYHGEEQSDEKLKSEAAKIGYPIMIKAVRGGGGKGMRIVMNEGEFNSSLDSARNESLKAFDDDKMLIEKFVERPRHVEVQVFADRYGNTVYLFERDCSVQRRHQKIIEEAPAPGLSPAIRKQLGEAAVKAAKAVGYVGAGTVEFIMDKNQNFFFMEMNTRLQVEHPVSEMITGVDLVELQIKAASGEVLPFTQDDLKINGHSFEARIYAEDPNSNFMPGTGSLEYLSTPPSTQDVRIETGVRQGDEVSQYYDPMIAKLVVWDECRSSALRKLILKLNEYHIVGLGTNLDFLTRLASHPQFQKADVHTGFIDEYYDELFPEHKALTEEQIAQATLSLILHSSYSFDQSPKQTDQCSPFYQASSYQMNLFTNEHLQLVDGEQEIDVRVTHENDGKIMIKVGEQEFECHGKLVTNDNGQTFIHSNIDGKIEKFSVLSKEDCIHVFTKDGHFKVDKTKPKFISETLEATTPQGAIAPMTGSILEVRVNKGDLVKAGDVVAVIYAMKLEHNIAAPYDGIVEEVFAVTGTTVNQNDEIVKIVESEK